VRFVAAISTRLAEGHGLAVVFDTCRWRGFKMTKQQAAGGSPDKERSLEIELEDLYPIAGLISLMTYLLLG
jgi:hypothetical protein